MNSRIGFQTKSNTAIWPPQTQTTGDRHTMLPSEDLEKSFVVSNSEDGQTSKTHFAVEKGSVGFCGQWKLIRDNKILGH